MECGVGCRGGALYMRQRGRLHLLRSLVSGWGVPRPRHLRCKGVAVEVLSTPHTRGNKDTCVHTYFPSRWVTNQPNVVDVIRRSRSGMPAVTSRSGSWLGTLTASAASLGTAVCSAPVAGTASSATGTCGSGGMRPALLRWSRMSRCVGRPVVWACIGSGGTASPGWRPRRP